ARVLEPRPRLPAALLPLRQAGERMPEAGGDVDERDVGGLLPVDPRRHPQQVQQRDAVVGGARQLGDVAGDRVVGGVDVPLADRDADRGGGERLRHRPRLEEAVAVRGEVVLVDDVAAVQDDEALGARAGQVVAERADAAAVDVGDRERPVRVTQFEGGGRRVQRGDAGAVPRDGGGGRRGRRERVGAGAGERGGGGGGGGVCGGGDQERVWGGQGQGQGGGGERERPGPAAHADLRGGGCGRGSSPMVIARRRSVHVDG